MLLVAVKAVLTCLTHGTRSFFALADDLTERPAAQGMVKILPLIVEMMGDPRTNVAHIPMEWQLPVWRWDVKAKHKIGDRSLGHSQPSGTLSHLSDSVWTRRAA